jgi:metallo-beta-lactamase class B
MIAVLLAAIPLLHAAELVEIDPAVAESRVPSWDARGLGRLPWQGIACLEASDDGRFLAVGTTAPPGDPNLFVLDEHGRVVSQHRAGLRWVNEVTISGDGRFVAGLSTTPEGTAGDTPRLFGFQQGRELTQVSDSFRFRDFRPGKFLFHYGAHSNHLPGVSRWAGDQWVVAGDDRLHWLSPSDSTLVRVAHLGQGTTTALAVNADGLVVVGRACNTEPPSDQFQDLLVLDADKPEPLLWSRPVSSDAEPSPKPEKGVYGPPVPPYEDVRFQAPLAVAVDTTGARIVVADYEGWQRLFHQRDGSADRPFGTRFMPSRPTIHIYDAKGNTVQRIGPDTFPEAFWCNLTFSVGGRKLLVWPHNWTSRGLGGQPFLPADKGARTLYVLDMASGGIQAVRFPDAISSVGTGGGDTTAVGCWDHKVYLLNQGCRPIQSLPKGLDVGAASLVRVSADGNRIAVAASTGTVRMLDRGGKQLWQTDLNTAAQPGDKPWTRNQRPGEVAPGIWRTNGGLAHSDMGSQNLIEAPRGLILIDPNAGASFEQNWAKIEAAGFDPMQVKYVLLTHEHGDHAPGAYLWRVVTGAQVVASAEMAYVLQHRIPAGTGYGFHPPVPADIVLTGDRELDLAGLQVKAARLSGHTFGSMGYAFQKHGKTYVATGDLIMPGGTLGYSGSLDFSAEDVLHSLKKLAALKPDVVLGGHGGGDPDEFIAKGIEAGEATGWSRMTPPKPNPLHRFAQTNYLIAAWLEPILSAAYDDVDGDGRPDVAVLVPSGKGSAVKIYLNRAGNFQDSPDAVVELPELSRGWKLRTVRLTGGRVADFFASSQGQVMLLLSRQEQLRFKVVPLRVIRGAHVAAGDFDANGKTDLVIGSRFVRGYYVACQQEDGVFRVRQTEAPTQSYLDIALADVSDDTQEDLITSCGDIFLRQPDGTLAEMPSFHLTPPAGEPQGWAFMGAADFDTDGRTDVALMAHVEDGAAVWLYRNSGSSQDPFPGEPSAKFVVADTVVNRDGPTVADFNGDGALDLILCAKDKPPGARILLGSPSDGLNPQRVLAVPLDYVPHFDTRFGVADFNGDGRLDLAGFGPSPTGAVGVYIWLQPGVGIDR